MRIVAALGGNALLRRGEPMDMDTQRRNARAAAFALAELAQEHQLIVTHGNGPQVGLLALHDAETPLDILGAESEGMIGYILEQELRTVLPGREIAILLTLVSVDPKDPAFSAPTKPIGPVYGEAEGRKLAKANGWTMVPDGDGIRRAVPSPAPLEVLERATVERLCRAGTLVICAGGGGVPVSISESGVVRGVEAVVDKDRTAALLAEQIGADMLLLLTDVDAVYLDWGSERARAVRAAPPEALRGLNFDAGSMGPKVEAACRFAETTGKRAVIGALEDAAAMAARKAGTQVYARLKSLALR